MKKVLLVLAWALISLTVAHAQEKRPVQKKGPTTAFWYQAGVISLNGHSEFQSVDLVIAPGYAFNNRLFVRLQGELSIGLFDVSPVKTYEINGLLGASVGYNFTNWGYWGSLEGNVTVGNTLFSKNFSFIYYDAAIRWNLPVPDITKLSFGIGVRYYRSHNSAFADFCNLYAALGVRFN